MKTKTTQEQRIEVASDVLMHIDSGKLEGKNMTYLSVDTLQSHIGKSLQKVLGRFKKCKACALGGMFYALIMRHNDYKITIDVNTVPPSTMREILGKVFTKKQLLLVESAFEETFLCAYHDYTTKTQERAKNYTLRHHLNNGQETLIHIMNNIIKNNGTFKP